MSVESVTIDRFDPLAPEVLRDPYPYYRWLRENDPVHWGAPGDSDDDGTWYITRYDDVMTLLTDQRFGREIWRLMPEKDVQPVPDVLKPIVETSRQWMVLRDPPVQTRLRQMVHRVFTPRMITRLTPRISDIANDLLDRVQDKGRIEVITDFSLPLAVIAVAEMLGIPGDERYLFIPWTKALAAVIEFKQSDEVLERGSRAIIELNDYLRDIIAQRRRSPQDDLISALLEEDDSSDDPISEIELLGTCTQLLFGGNDPVAHMIGNGLVALFEHPDQLEAWRADPGITGPAVEEILRYDSSVQMTFRYALEDVEFGGKQMRQGDLVATVFGAANRDPEQYDDPDTLILTRKPNRHTSLGHGIHYCMGAALSRVEGQVAFNLLFERLPEMEVETQNVQWNETVAVRGVKELVISF